MTTSSRPAQLLNSSITPLSPAGLNKPVMLNSMRVTYRPTDVDFLLNNASNDCSTLSLGSRGAFEEFQRVLSHG